jgi:two-component system cell cycle sensor histidine kinase PleC
VSLSRGIWLPLLVTLASLWTTRLVRQFRADTSVSLTQENIIHWQRRLVYAQAGMGVVWGISPWLLWQSSSALNHLFLAAVMVVIFANIVVSRANHGSVILAGLIPAAILPTLRFLTDASALNLALAFIVPGMAAQIYRDAMRMTRRMDEDSRLRFQVEDLARELEDTRDEALRKRFEAETANASKTAFLANMSHELRTPLNAILGFSEIIQQECFGPAGSPRYVEYAGDIHSSGAHLLSLINDLLDVAKIEAGKMELQPRVLDARQALETALKLIGGKARERRQELLIEVEPSAPALYADERALKQILINLASNAVKFSPPGGKISVVGSPAADGAFQIVVRDNGPGVPREKLDKIFVPFNQVDNRYDRQAGGTGLGLALVRGLVELHGGRAWIESEPGKGCRAYVVLPPPPDAALPSMAAA